jgi:hypothetical protein
MAMALTEIGRDEKALELVGAAERVRHSAGPVVAPRWTVWLESARERSEAALGMPAAQRAYARGRAQTIDTAVEAALRLQAHDGTGAEIT